MFRNRVFHIVKSQKDEIFQNRVFHIVKSQKDEKYILNEF